MNVCRPPIVLYDDRCSLCTSFARCVKFFSGRKVTLVGHYSSSGEELRRSILGSDALDMFWFVDEDTAFGGRAALWPLIKNAVLGASSGEETLTHAETAAVGCKASDCSAARDVFIRSASLIRNSRIIRIRQAG